MNAVNIFGVNYFMWVRINRFNAFDNVIFINFILINQLKIKSIQIFIIRQRNAL